MAEYNPGGDKLVNILCTSGGVASEVAEKFEERVIRMSQLSSAV